MIRYAALLALLLVATPAQATRLIWDENDTEKSWKHTATGLAIGAGAMGFCTELTNRLTGKHQTLPCYGGTLLLTAAAYYVKERRDGIIYAHGRVVEGRDMAEGIGGAAAGAGVLIPIVGW